MRWTRRGKRRLVFLCALVIVAGAGALGYRQWSRAQHERIGREARVAGLADYEAGDYKSALPNLSLAAGRNRRDVEVLLAFADSRLRIPQEEGKHVRQGIALYNAVLVVEPAHREALEGLLGLYRGVGYQVEALGMAERLLELDVDHVDALSLRALAARREGRFGEARVAFERLAVIQPDEIAWRAMILETDLQEGVPEEDILSLCRQWIDEQSAGTDGRFHLLEAQHLAMFKRTAEAGTAMEKAIARGADDAVILERMIALLDGLGLAADANALLASAREARPEAPWVYEVEVAWLWRQGRRDSALEVLTQAERELDPMGIDLLRWRALILATATGSGTSFESALDDYRTRGETLEDPDGRTRVDAWSNLIEAIARDASPTERLELCGLAGRSGESDPVLHSFAAAARQDLGEHDEAARLLQNALASAPNWPDASISLAQSLLILERPREAHRVAQSMVQSGVGGDTALLLLARAWLDLGIEGAGMVVRFDPDGADGPDQPIDNDLVGLLETLDGVLSSEDSRPALPLLIAAYVRYGRGPDAEALIDRVIAGAERVPDQVIGDLAETCQSWDAVRAVALLDRLDGGGDVLTRATILRSAGHADAARAAIEAALPGATGDQARDLAWLAAMLRLEGKDPDGARDVNRLSQTENDVARLFRALQERIVWEDEKSVTPIIDRLEALAGAGSIQLQLARARLVLEHHADDPERVAEAVDAVNAVIDRDPRSKPALELEAMLLLGQNRTSVRAAQRLEELVRLYPNDLRNAARLIEVLLQRGEQTSARGQIRDLLSRAGSLWEYRRVASQWLERLGDAEQAETVIEAIPEDARTDADRQSLARLALRRGDPDAAVDLYATLLDAADATVETIAGAAEAMAEQGRTDAALDLIADRIDDPGERAFTEARILAITGNTDEAQARFERAAQLLPDRVDVLDGLAMSCLSREDFVGASDALLAALAVDSLYPATRTKLLVVAFGRDHDARRHLADRVRRLLTPGAERSRTDPLVEVLDLVATDPASLDDETLGRAVELVREHPDDFAARWASIQLHADAGRLDEAIDLAEEAAARLPADPLIAQRAAELLIQAGRLSEAVVATRRWRQLTAVSGVHVDVVLAAVLLDLDRSVEALACLSPYAAVLRDETVGDRTCLMWLQSLLRAGRNGEAAREMSSLLAASEDWAMPFLSLTPELSTRGVETVAGVVEPVLGATDEGRYELARYMAAAAGRLASERLGRRADQLAASIGGQWRDAADTLRAGVATNEGRIDDATALYRGVIDRKPGDVTASNNLAYLIVRHGGDPEEAVRLARVAAEGAGGHPAALDTLAQALLATGRNAEAEQTIGLAINAVDADPSLAVASATLEPGLRLTLAAILNALGREADARDQLRLAQQLASESGVEDADLERRIATLERAIPGNAGG